MAAVPVGRRFTAAAIPSVVYGLWGFSVLEAAVPGFSRWLRQHLAFVPIFHVDADPNPSTTRGRYST